MAQKPSIPKGTRDFGPVETVRRNFIFDTIKQVFHRYGYQPIETPAMENLSTLLGKYGEEGDKLLFRVLNSGDFMAGYPAASEVPDPANLLPFISEKGLRYDLTVPFARFVVQNRNDITFPFKRYQIQPVWRADRPQKGRYREFFQCDADVIGSDSLLNEAELVMLVDEVFSALGINIVVKINNRKILAGIASYIGYPESLIDITIAIDKLDKIGLDAVNQELMLKGIPADAVSKLQPVLNMQGDSVAKIQNLRQIIGNNETGNTGLDEINTLFGFLEQMKPTMPYELDLTLARGLNYYTGAIFEVKALDVQMGSICGGGRYDDLTGVFGMPGVSGVGISFGADRIYDVMAEKQLFPETTAGSTFVLFLNFGADEVAYSIPSIALVRKAGINAELYPDADKLKKQFKYADQKLIPYVVIAGETEISAKVFTVRNMKSGSQQNVPVHEIVEFLQDIAEQTE
ncbi:MAG: histidine--tRNA ligase [Bacteroidales bacterium]|nr:histidine--tRNA ligase [Bacteroidales bacterium]